MRILQLLNHTRRLNGHVHAAVDLACAETRLGHTVAIASGGGDFDLLLAANEIETMSVDHQRRPVTLMKGLTTLHRVARRWKPDVIHAHMVTSALLAWPVCKSLGIPLVTTVHNEFEKGAKLMGVGTRVIAVSDAVGQSMRRRGIASSKLDVVLNGTIGSARFVGKDRTPRPLDSPAIVFVGGQHPRKGLPDLLAAFNTIYASNPRVRLYVVGDGPCLATYVDMARSMPSGNAISFLGAQDDPFPFLLGADIFVLPSHADPAPLVLSEAREAGCAIIATDVDGIPELLEHGKAGILIPARNPEKLAEALSSLVEDAKALELWRQKSQFNIEHLRIERVAQQTLEVYAMAQKQVKG
jgi:glycosyltransferase involved in cell wall biosynthesis